MTRLYVVRHGNTFEANEEPRRIGARTDLPLTAVGHRQAELLGRMFGAEVQFARAFSSNLARTRATAEAILALQPHPVVLEQADFLVEIDHGPDENKPESEVLERVGRSALALWDNDLVPPAGWDVGTDWRVAAWQAFAQEMERSNRGDAILLVTSNGAARFSFPAFGLIGGDKNRTVKLRTGSYGLIEFDGGHFRLISWDRRPDQGAA